jgi:NadR type nicotinamide-nucleotide adenylyltransferase
MLKKIAITGPESTGKSTLSKQLANHYNTMWVEEYARDYINQLNRPYTQEDILAIAKKQKEIEEQKSKETNTLLFSDTELIVTKIWSEVKYQSCDQWILNNIEKQDYLLYLLCDIDLPWEYDPQREHPNKRVELFDLYKSELQNRKLNFKIILGNNEERLQNAIRIIDTLLP